MLNVERVHFSWLLFPASSALHYLCQLWPMLFIGVKLWKSTSRSRRTLNAKIRARPVYWTVSSPSSGQDPQLSIGCWRNARRGYIGIFDLSKEKTFIINYQSDKNNNNRSTIRFWSNIKFKRNWLDQSKIWIIDLKITLFFLRIHPFKRVKFHFIRRFERLPGENRRNLTNEIVAAKIMPAYFRLYHRVSPFLARLRPLQTRRAMIPRPCWINR